MPVRLILLTAVVSSIVSAAVTSIFVTLLLNGALRPDPHLGSPGPGGKTCPARFFGMPLVASERNRDASLAAQH
jgi:hypothetical protein